MIDPIDCWVSRSASIHILHDAWDSDPLRFGSFALRIAPPFSRFFCRLTHAKYRLANKTLIRSLAMWLLRPSCNSDFYQQF
jgi:hypothetical protein